MWLPNQSLQQTGRGAAQSTSELSGPRPAAERQLVRRGHSALSLVLTITTALGCPGCLVVGVTTVAAQEGEASNPYFGRQYDGDKVVDGGQRQEPLPSSRLLEAWGEPDDREEQPDGSERWRYNGFIRAAGVVILVIVPIPLVIPTGLEHVDFIVQDDTVVHAYSSGNTFPWGWVCGWAPSSMHGDGWFAEGFSSPTTGFTNPFE